MLQPMLEDLVASVEDSMGAAVLNLDGVVIEAYDATGLDPEPAHALPEFGQVIRQLQAVGETFDIGELKTAEVGSTDRITILRPLTEQYLIALWVKPGALVAKARFRLRLAAPGLAAQL